VLLCGHNGDWWAPTVLCHRKLCIWGEMQYQGTQKPPATAPKKDPPGVKTGGLNLATGIPISAQPKRDDRAWPPAPASCSFLTTRMARLAVSMSGNSTYCPSLHCSSPIARKTYCSARRAIRVGSLISGSRSSALLDIRPSARRSDAGRSGWKRFAGSQC
jgi:hypothetical protein